MAEEIVSDFLSKCLVSVIYTETAFASLITQQMPELDKTTIKDMYSQYKRTDSQLLEEISMLIKRKYASGIQQLELEQIEDSVSLNEVIEILETINGLLQEHLAKINSNTKRKNQRLSEYANEIDEIQPIDSGSIEALYQLIKKIESNQIKG